MDISLADGLRIGRLRYGELARTERASRAELLATQTRHLDRLLAHTAAHSPFYRERWGGRAPRAADLQQLEPITRTDLVQHMDRLLTDCSLSRKVLYGWLGKPGRHPYVVVATSGTTGEPVIVPYSHEAWTRAVALLSRGLSRIASNTFDLMWTGRRAASIVTRDPIHLSPRLREAIALKVPRQLHLAAGMPLEELIEQLERFRPTQITGYPSVIDLLARAQLAGELHIAPRRVTTGGETHPAGFRERLRAAWQAEVFDGYGLTETQVIAWECRAHAGMHIDEDAVVLEVVDEHDRVLPSEALGDALLVTSLLSETLPIIRYRVGDLLRITDEPCVCGRPFARIVSVDGRQEEWLDLRNGSGAPVRLRPSVVEAPLQTTADIRRFQLRNPDGKCQVLVVPHRPAAGLDAAIRQRLVAAVASRGVPADAVAVTIVETIDDERGRTDKRRRVVR